MAREIGALSVQQIANRLYEYAGALLVMGLEPEGLGVCETAEELSEEGPWFWAYAANSELTNGLPRADDDAKIASVEARAWAWVVALALWEGVQL